MPLARQTAAEPPPGDRAMTRLALLLSLLGVAHPGALAQLYLFNATGEASVSYGVAVAFVGDVDGDLHEDYAVSAPDAGDTALGRVYLRSGFTGEAIATLAPPGTLSMKFGRGVAGLGDVDGDSRGDLAVSDNLWTDLSGQAKGRVVLLSGRTGAALWTFIGPPVAASLGTGRHLDDAGDVNGDGVHDLFVCGSSNTSTELAQAYLLSGATGTALRSWPGGRVGSIAGDADADGIVDVAILRVLTSSSASVTVYSGRTGVQLWTQTISGLVTDGASGFYAKSLAPAGDVDGDGRDDLAVGLTSLGDSAQIRSGLNGSLLRSFWGGGGRFGLAMAPASDVDGDGHDELLVAAVGTGVLELRSPYLNTVLDTFVMGTAGQDTEAFSLAYSTCSKRHLAYPLPATATPLGRMLAWDGGQLNSTRAALWVGTGPVPCCAGPGVAALTPGTPLVLNWLGPPNAPLLLLAGPRHPHHAFYPAFGMADLGTPPFYGDVTILLDGTQGTFPGVFFRTDAGGAARQSFPTPALPPGILAHLQGLVLQPAGAPAPVVLTAAVTLEAF